MATTNGTSLYNVSEIFLNQPDLSNLTTTLTPIPVHQDVPLSLYQTRFAVQTVLTPIVVIIGLLGNILNILVLLQPSMRSSTNVYILVLSFADSIYLIFNFALSILVCRKRGLSDSAYYFNPYGRFVSNFSGNVAVWVTVGFTVERYIAVCHPMHGKRWCTVSRAKIASSSIVVLTLINTLPTIFELEVVRTDNGFRCQYTDFANQFSYEMVYSWWYVTFFTFVPLICLAIFNIVLIRVLLVASRKRQELVMISSRNKSSNHRGTNVTGNGSTLVNKYVPSSNGNGHQDRSDSASSLDSYNHTTSPTCLNPVSKCQMNQHKDYTQHKGNNVNSNVNKKLKNKRISMDSSRSSVSTATNLSMSNIKRQGKRMSREQNKVTLLLVTIVMIFFLCQLPWTALFLYKTYLSNNNLSGNQTHIKIAGNICNLLGLINASGNFYLYSCFSKRFRKTFKSLVLFWRNKSTILTSMV